MAVGISLHILLRFLCKARKPTPPIRVALCQACMCAAAVQQRIIQLWRRLKQVAQILEINSLTLNNQISEEMFDKTLTSQHWVLIISVSVILFIIIFIIITILCVYLCHRKKAKYGKLAVFEMKIKLFRCYYIYLASLSWFIHNSSFAGTFST